jgi:hypothetical protein
VNALYAINLYRITFDEWLAGEETSEQEFNERYRPKVAEALRASNQRRSRGRLEIRTSEAAPGRAKAGEGTSKNRVDVEALP